MNTEVYAFEVQRKTFHLCSLIVPIIYFFITKKPAIITLFLFTSCVLYLDISRHYNFRVRKLTDRFFSHFMRNHEQSGSFSLSGSTYMALGFFITALLFSKGLAIASWFILIIADTLAALIGTKVGVKMENGKSLEGSIAFLASAIFISMIVYFFIGYNTSFSIIIVSSIITTLSEFYSKELSVNDNLSIPITYCLSTVIFSFLLGL
ncbi:MAG: SEC59/DGK1/VTE5 family protein [Rickettsia endosymbiont of Bryobia graminum]|nr:SEC59/DGK1/VTE5 family protein [Rickettsia endosymbiont of Bryobia graminum]